MCLVMIEGSYFSPACSTTPGKAYISFVSSYALSDFARRAKSTFLGSCALATISSPALRRRLAHLA